MDENEHELVMWLDGWTYGVHDAQNDRVVPINVDQTSPF